MTAARCDFVRIRWGLTAFASAALLFVLMLVSARTPFAGLDHVGSAGTTQAAPSEVSPSLADLAANRPGKRAEVIVQLANGTDSTAGRALVRSLGGRVTGDLHVINGLAAVMTAANAKALASKPGVRVVSLNAGVKKNSVTISSKALLTSYNESVQATQAWGDGATGKGVGVAVVDTGIAGDQPDFRVSQSDSASRVNVTAVVNPYATDDYDGYGHGTHVAGIIAGNGTNRAASDPLYGDYAGVAPEANLIAVKASDDAGEATVLDVIYGLQFVVDNKDAYNIRVVNLSLESTDPQSYRTDPLDAAAEAAWFKGIVVVAAAGNRGTADDAVDYAPGNDPYVISVGGVDDGGSKVLADDTLASWSSRGTTQDGYAKPEITAPGAHIVSNLSPNSEFSRLCPSCIVSGEYIRAGGTSMAAPVVAGAVADLLQVHPEMTPNRVKGALLATGRTAKSGALEVSVMGLERSGAGSAPANQGLVPNNLINPATGAIDYTRSRWSRSSWSRSRWSRSSWSRSSWSCACSKTKSGSIDPTRSSWSRSSWSTSWTK